MPKYTDDTEYESPESTNLRQGIITMSTALTKAIGELREASIDWAKKDNEMRKAKAKAFLQATGKNKEEREAKADAYWEKERLAANIAEGEKNTAAEHVRSLRAQMSAYQSLVYANRAESESITYKQTQTT
jgi:uncharacterized NAD(P)/FAD-binding protein YdhS